MHYYSISIEDFFTNLIFGASRSTNVELLGVANHGTSDAGDISCSQYLSVRMYVRYPETYELLPPLMSTFAPQQRGKQLLLTYSLRRSLGGDRVKNGPKSLHLNDEQYVSKHALYLYPLNRIYAQHSPITFLPLHSFLQ